MSSFFRTILKNVIVKKYTEDSGDSSEKLKFCSLDFIWHQSSISFQDTQCITAVKTREISREDRKRKWLQRGCGRIGFTKPTRKRWTAITVGNPYTLCVNCNLYTTLLPENVSCHIRGLYHVFQICRVSLANRVFFGECRVNMQYFLDNPMERVISDIHIHIM